MARFSFITWDGGGNVGPAIALAQGLAGLGHSCRFLGYRAQRARVERQGFEFDELARSGVYDLVRDAPEKRLDGMMRHVWSCPEHLMDVTDGLAVQPADVAIVDFVMHGALAAAERAGLPTASLVHGAVAGFVATPGTPMAVRRVAAANALRLPAGLPAIESTIDAWARFPMVVTTVRELDTAAASLPGSPHYVGPLVERFTPAEWKSPWKHDDPRPLVVVSFSTTGMWDQRSRVERTLAALAGEPVRVLVCDGAADGLPLPGNGAARGFVPHADVLPLAACVVTHCGHGTVTAALAHGVPIVGLPNSAADQPYLARRVEELGAGLALDGDAAADAIRAAVLRAIHEPSFSAGSRRMAESIASAPGVGGAAALVARLARS